jgi:hypothetical protein
MSVVLSQKMLEKMSCHGWAECRLSCHRKCIFKNWSLKILLLFETTRSNILNWLLKHAVFKGLFEMSKNEISPTKHKKVLPKSTLHQKLLGYFSQSHFYLHVLASLALFIVRQWSLLKNQQKYSKVVGGTLTPKKLSPRLWSKKNHFGHFWGFKNVQNVFLLE